MPVIEPTAIALVLTPDNDPASLVTWDIAIAPSSGPSEWLPWIPSAWHANACARGFAALELLANRECCVATVPLSPELNLELRRC
jgi:hypothetical protein